MSIRGRQYRLVVGGVDTPPAAPKWLKTMERETGVEPATFSLGSGKANPHLQSEHKQNRAFSKSSLGQKGSLRAAQGPERLAVRLAVEPGRSLAHLSASSYGPKRHNNGHTGRSSW